MSRIRRGWDLTKLITFLAVPVIALEGTGPFQTLKRSSSLFRSRWGAQVTGNIAIGGAVFLFGVLPSALLIFAGFLVWASASFAGALPLVLGIIGLAISMLVSSALSNIFGVALYRYALDGEAVGGFTAEELESAVKSRKGAAPRRRQRRAPSEATYPRLTPLQGGQPRIGCPSSAKRRGSLETRPLTPAATRRCMRTRSSTVQAISSTPASAVIRARRLLTSG